jgi:hypothetical protein
MNSLATCARTPDTNVAVFAQALSTYIRATYEKIIWKCKPCIIINDKIYLCGWSLLRGSGANSALSSPLREHMSRIKSKISSRRQI